MEQDSKKSVLVFRKSDLRVLNSQDLQAVAGGSGIPDKIPMNDDDPFPLSYYCDDTCG